MKRTLCTITMLVMVLGLFVGCGNKGKQEAEKEPTVTTAPVESVTNTPTPTDAPTAAPTEEPTPTAIPVPEKVLVVVFSATGHTKTVAEMIAKTEEGDLYEIIPETPYTEADINYSDYNCRALIEQMDSASRPVIGSEKIDLAGYTKIYVGYPIWAGKEPRILDTFVESYDFGNATVIPFCTSGSSGIGSTGTNLGKLAGSGNWQTGKRFPATATEEDVRKWIESMQ